MKVFILALLLVPGAAHSADDRARRDLNGVPGILGVDETTGETRRIKTKADGTLITFSSGTLSISGTVDQGAAGAEEWPVKTSSTTSSVEVVATDLDIRDLTTGRDSVNANITNVSVPVDDNSGSLTVDSFELDIRDIDRSRDSVSVDGSTVGVRNAAGESLAVNDDGLTLSVDDGGGSLTVDTGALSLDVNVTNVSVSVDDGGTALSVSQEGFATVSISSVSVSTSIATQLLASNANRKSHGICPEGNDVVRVGFDSSVTNEIGIPAQPGSCSTLDGPGPYTGALFAVATGTAPAKVTVFETSP